MNAVKLIKENCQTGEDWAIYEVEINGSWDWVNVIEVYCSVSNNRIMLDEPICLSAH